MTTPVTTYVELQVTSHFSFLRGASAPEELFAAAALLGHSALGLCDRGSVAGMVRGLSGQDATGVRLIPGSRVDLRDGRSLLLYPKDRAAWSRLTRLLSLGKARGGKGNCWLDWPDVVAWSQGLVAVLLPDDAEERTRLDLGDLSESFGRDAYLALSLRRRPGDFARLRALDTLARDMGVRSVAMSGRAPAPMARGDDARSATPRWQEAGLFLGAARPSAAPTRATPKAASKSDTAAPNVAADRADTRPKPAIEGGDTADAHAEDRRAPHGLFPLAASARAAPRGNVFREE